MSRVCQKPHVQTSRNFQHVLPVAVALMTMLGYVLPFFVDDITLSRNVINVTWTTNPSGQSPSVCCVQWLKWYTLTGGTASSKRKKERKSIYIAPFCTKGLMHGRSGMDPQFYLQTTPCLPFLRGVHQMSPPHQLRQQTSNCSSLLNCRPRKDERMSWHSWLTYSGWLTEISGHPSATTRAQDMQRKHIGQRPMLYRWTTPPTDLFRKAGRTESRGPKRRHRGGASGGAGQRAPPHQLGGLRERCKLL